MEGVTIVGKSNNDGFPFTSGPDPLEPNSFSRSRSPIPRWHIGTLIGVKVAGTFALFLLGDIMLKSLDPSVPLAANSHYFLPSGMFWRFSQFFQIITFIQFSSGTIFLLVQKPFTLNTPSTGTLFSRHDWMRIIRHSVCSTLLLVIRAAGLQLCGPFRTVFVSTHYDFTVASLIAAITLFKSGPRLRGTVLLGIGIILLLLSDEPPNPRLSESHHREDLSFFSTNSIGVLILIVSVFLKFGFTRFSRGLASDIGGPMRLHAVSTFVSGSFLAVLFIIDLMSSSDMIPVNILPLAFVVIFGFVLDFYADSYFAKKMESSQFSRIATTASHFAALLFTMLWTTSNDVPNLTTLIAFLLIYSGTISLTATEKASGTGSFVGYASDGLPLFNFLNQTSEERSSQLGKQIFRGIHSVLKQIRDDPTTRKIFYIFLINLAYSIVEFIYGHVTNSVSLISDGFHMLFDAFALLIGVCAPVISRCKPTNTFPFGFERVEVLCGFVNTTFFLLVALIVAVEAIQRLLSPPLVDATRVLPVALVGLVINLIGIYAFGNSNLHHGRYFPHPHSNSGQGLLLLLLVDTLGSIGTIISSVLMSSWGLLILDPLCSLIIVSLMVKNLFPLMKDHARILLLTIPVGMERNVQQVLLQLLSVEGVTGYKNHRLWVHSPEVFTGSISIQVTQDTNEQHLIRQVSSLFSSIGFTHFTIQVEKDEFIARRSVNVGAMDENSSDSGHKNTESKVLLGSSSAQFDLSCQKENSHLLVLPSE